MTIDELLAWKRDNQDAITEFLHHHRELSGIHFMPDESGNAYIEFSLKSEYDTGELTQEIVEAFGKIDFRFVVVDPDRDFRAELKQHPSP